MANRDASDPYLVLGVTPDMSSEDIRKAWLVLVQLMHPDRLADMPAGVREEAERRLQRINEAYRQITEGDVAPPTVDADDGPQASAQEHASSADSSAASGDRRGGSSSTYAWFARGGLRSIAESRNPARNFAILAASLGGIAIVITVALGSANDSPPGTADGAVDRVPESASHTAEGREVAATSVPSDETTLPTPTTSYLADSGTFEPTDSLNYEGGAANVNGQLYSNSIKLYPASQASGPVHASFVLGRAYRRMQAVVGVDDDATSEQRLRFQVVADGAVVFVRDLPKGSAVDLDLDVTGVYSVKFIVTKLTPDSTYNDGGGVFGDAKVTRLT